MTPAVNRPLNREHKKDMSMDIKQLLKTAIDAKIGGDQKGFQEAMKQVMSAKVGSILAEEDEAPYLRCDKSDCVGPIEVEVDDNQVPGLVAGIYQAYVDGDVSHFGRSTQGNFSSRASDPDEYFGEQPESELQMSTVYFYDFEDSSEEPLAAINGEEAQRVLSVEQLDDIQNRLMAKQATDAESRF